MTDADDLPVDPFPTVGPHALFVVGVTTDSWYWIMCADCNWDIIGTAQDRDAVLDIQAEHGRQYRALGQP